MTSPLHFGVRRDFTVHFHTGYINIEEFNAEARSELLPFQMRLELTSIH